MGEVDLRSKDGEGEPAENGKSKATTKLKDFAYRFYVTICTHFQQIRADVKNLYTGQSLFVVQVHFAGYTVAIESSTMKAVKRYF